MGVAGSYPGDLLAMAMASTATPIRPAALFIFALVVIDGR
jgi:hypothetical protein